MGFFQDLFGKFFRKNDPLDNWFKSEIYKLSKEYCEEIFDIAKAVSDNDPEVVETVRSMLDEPVKYFRENSQRYIGIGVDFSNEHFHDEFMAYDLFNHAAIAEMESRGYVSRVNLDCKLPEFRQGLSKVKCGEEVRGIIEAFEFSEDGDIVTWTEELNAELDGKAYIAFIIEMIEEKFALAVTDKKTSEMINGEILE